MTTEQMATALIATLKALLEERDRQPRPPRDFREVFKASMQAETPVAQTRDEMLLDRLARRPVIASLENAIRRVGEMAYQDGGIDRMREVKAAACDLEPRLAGKLQVVTNSKWDGIGEWMA